jgi:hypothetical protein
VIHHPLEVLGPHRFEGRVGRGIHEVDGVRHAVFHREFHGIEVVAERPAKRERVGHHALPQLRRRRRIAGHVAQMMRRAGVVAHDVDVLPVDRVAAEILLEFHAGLQRHAQVAALVVGGEQLFGRVHLRDVLPSAAIVRLQERGNPTY